MSIRIHLPRPLEEAVKFTGHRNRVMMGARISHRGHRRIGLAMSSTPCSGWSPCMALLTYLGRPYPSVGTLSMSHRSQSQHPHNSRPNSHAVDHVPYHDVPEVFHRSIDLVSSFLEPNSSPVRIYAVRLGVGGENGRHEGSSARQALPFFNAEGLLHILAARVPIIGAQHLSRCGACSASLLLNCTSSRQYRTVRDRNGLCRILSIVGLLQPISERQVSRQIRVYTWLTLNLGNIKRRNLEVNVHRAPEIVASTVCGSESVVAVTGSSNRRVTSAGFPSYTVNVPVEAFGIPSSLIIGLLSRHPQTPP